MACKQYRRCCPDLQIVSFAEERLRDRPPSPYAADAGPEKRSTGRRCPSKFHTLYCLCGGRCPNLAAVPTVSQRFQQVGDTKNTSKYNGVPNLTPWSQPLSIHSCERERKTAATFFSIRKEKDPRWGHRGWATFSQVVAIARKNAVPTFLQVGTMRSEVGTRRRLSVIRSQTTCPSPFSLCPGTVE